MIARHIMSRAAPILLGILVLAAWEGLVHVLGIKPYILPSPSAIFHAMAQEAGGLFDSLLFTLRITLEAFGLALVFGLGLGIAFTRSKIL